MLCLSFAETANRPETEQNYLDFIVSDLTLVYVPASILNYLVAKKKSCSSRGRRQGYLRSILCHENGSGMKDKLLICSWHGMITLFGLKGSLHAKPASNPSRIESRRVAGKIVSKLKKWLGEKHWFRGLWKVGFLVFLNFFHFRVFHISVWALKANFK